MNFSLRTLLIITAGVAVICASLVYATPIVGDLFYTLGLLMMAFSTIAAIYRRGSQRAYWIGFVILFATYFCHTVWPSEIRGTWTVMQRGRPFGFPTQDLITTRLLSFLYQGLHGDMPTSVAFGPRAASVDPAPAAFVAFVTVGHTAFALLLGLAGGAMARRFALPAAPVIMDAGRENTP
jgi:hypothetical protein